MKSALCIAFAFLALLPPAHATPIPVDFQFNGFITSASNDPVFNTLIAPNHTLSGYLKFDGSIKATTAGHWDLPNAVFHMTIDKLTIDGIGATAQMITPNKDYFSFFISGDSFSQNLAPPDQLQINGAMVSIEFFTFGETLFSAWELPITVPPRDHYLVMSVWGDNWSGQASTDTNFSITAAPEPASLMLFGAGLLAAGWRRRLSRSALA